jgi:PPOX class probable F420-dependent enzyme
MATLQDPALRAYLEAHRVGHLGTADVHAAPHVVPVTFALATDAIVFIIDEKPKRAHGTRLKRMRNIVANPHVAFLVDDYDENWDRLGYALLRGRAEIVDRAGPTYGDAVLRLRARYPQYERMDPTPKRNPVVRITPEHVHWWRAMDH